MRAFYFGGLAGDDLLDRGGQVFLHRVLVSGDGAVFTALGFGENGVPVAVGHRALDVDPGAVHRAAHAARIFRVGFAQFHDFALQLAGEFGTLE